LRPFFPNQGVSVRQGKKGGKATDRVTKEEEKNDR